MESLDHGIGNSTVFKACACFFEAGGAADNKLSLLILPVKIVTVKSRLGPRLLKDMQF